MLEAVKQRSIEIHRQRKVDLSKTKRHQFNRRKRESRTIAILIEQAEGLLELRDLVVGELVRHSFSSKLRSEELQRRKRGGVCERRKRKRLFYF
jgi:predicted RNA-binding protein (virulence factor B family)